MSLLRDKKSYVFLGLLWIMAWVIPWGAISFQGCVGLVFVFDMFKLGLSIVLFIIPGLLLYVLFSKDEKLLSLSNSGGFIPIGITFSVLIVSLIGFVGRVLGFSFVAVKNIFVFVGVIEIALLSLDKPKDVFIKKKTLFSFLDLCKNPPLIFALVLSSLMMFHDQLFFVDDYTYLAYLTNWQHSDLLGFRNIVHEMDVVENARYWLTMLPMSQALLANISGLSGILLLGGYLELYLVGFAIITMYWLSRTLGLSKKEAGFAALIQITLYAWMIAEYVPTGYWFYLSMSEDKVFATFLIFPVLLFFCLRFLKTGKKRNLLFIFFSGTAMVLTHPVMFLFSTLIILGISLIALLFQKIGWRDFFRQVIVFALMLIPPFIVRLYLLITDNLPVDAVSVTETFEVSSVVRVVSDIFYGMVPDSLLLMNIDLGNKLANIFFQAYRFSPVIIIVVAMVIALWKISRRDYLYWYTFISSLLTLFAVIPYTGWVLGYFASARMIPRVSWFLPIGISAVIIWRNIDEFLRRKHLVIQRKNILIVGMVMSFVFVSPILFLGASSRFSAYFEIISYYKELGEVGAYIDANTKRPVMAIALDYKDTQYLPGVSSRVRLISFRERKVYNSHNDSLTLEEAQSRIDDSNFIQSLAEQGLANDYCKVLDKYDIRFVLADDANMEKFLELTNGCVRNFHIVFETETLYSLATNSFFE